MTSALSKNVYQLDTSLQLHALWLLVRGLYISKNTSIEPASASSCPHCVHVYMYDAKIFTTDLHSYTFLLVTKLEQPYNSCAPL